MIETLNRKKPRGYHTPIRRKKYQDSSREIKEELVRHLHKKSRPDGGGSYDEEDLYLGYNSSFEKNKKRNLVQILGETDTSKRVSFSEIKRKIIRNKLPRKKKSGLPKISGNRPHSSMDGILPTSPISSPMMSNQSLEKIKLSIRKTPQKVPLVESRPSFMFSPNKNKTLPSRTKMISVGKDGSRILKVYSRPPNLRNEGYEAFDEDVHGGSTTLNDNFGNPMMSRPKFVEDRFMKEIMDIDKRKRLRKKSRRINMFRNSYPGSRGDEEVEEGEIGVSRSMDRNVGMDRPFTNPAGKRRPGRVNHNKKKKEEEEEEEDILKNRRRKRPKTSTSVNFDEVASNADLFDEDLTKLYKKVMVHDPSSQKKEEKEEGEERGEEEEPPGNISPIDPPSPPSPPSSSIPDFDMESGVGEPLRLQYDPTQIKQISSLSSHMVNSTLKDYLMMVEACSRAGKSRLEGLCHYRIATMYEDKGNFRSSIRHFRKFLYLCRELNDVVGQCLGLNRLGVLHQILASKLTKRGQSVTQNKKKEIFSTGNKFEEEEEDYQEKRKKVSHVSIRENLTKKQKKHIKKSLNYHLKHWNLSDLQNKIVAHINMGLLFLKYLKNKKEASENFKAACRYAISIGDKHGQSIALANLGILRKADGDLGMARKCIEKQLKISKRIQDERSRTDAYQKLGVIASKKGNDDEAIRMLTKARKIAVEYNDQGKGNQIKCYLGILKGNKMIETRLRDIGEKIREEFEKGAERSREETIQKKKRKEEIRLKKKEEEEEKEKEKEKEKEEKEKIVVDEEELEEERKGEGEKEEMEEEGEKEGRDNNNINGEEEEEEIEEEEREEEEMEVEEVYMSGEEEEGEGEEMLVEEDFVVIEEEEFEREHDDNEEDQEEGEGEDYDSEMSDDEQLLE